MKRLSTNFNLAIFVLFLRLWLPLTAALPISATKKLKLIASRKEAPYINVQLFYEFRDEKPRNLYFFPGIISWMITLQMKYLNNFEMQIAKMFKNQRLFIWSVHAYLTEITVQHHT